MTYLLIQLILPDHTHTHCHFHRNKTQNHEPMLCLHCSLPNCCSLWSLTNLHNILKQSIFLKIQISQNPSQAQTSKPSKNVGTKHLSRKSILQLYYLGCKLALSIGIQAQYRSHTYFNFFNSSSVKRGALEESLLAPAEEEEEGMHPVTPDKVLALLLM